MAQAGEKVAVHYTGTLDNGEVFDSSRQREPLEFTVGAGQMIPGFDAAVNGMTVGETKTVRLEPSDAYGERSDDAIIELPAEGAPEGLEVGDQVQMNTGARATVLEVTDATVTLDLNHPLAGEALTFEIELVSVG